MSEQLLVKEIFHSLQGESTASGLRFGFIRLSGCNLRCSYCDTSYAFHGGERLSIEQIVEQVIPFKTKNILITGGEPLLQRKSADLAKALFEQGFLVSIETHGECDVSEVSPFSRIIMDIKTPGSGECREGFKNNFKFLKPTDEIKFVIASVGDYDWARNWVMSGALPSCEILFSAALPHTQSPGRFSGVEPSWLADKILKDQLPVRFQLQLHKIIGAR